MVSKWGKVWLSQTSAITPEPVTVLGYSPLCLICILDSNQNTFIEKCWRFGYYIVAWSTPGRKITVLFGMKQQSWTRRETTPRSWLRKHFTSSSQNRRSYWTGTKEQPSRTAGDRSWGACTGHGLWPMTPPSDPTSDPTPGNPELNELCTPS